MVDKPEMTMTILPANQEVSNDAQKILFIGQKTASGSAASGALQEDVKNAIIDSLLGSDSFLAAGLRAAKKINKITPMDVIALEDAAGGSYAAGAFVITGLATAKGSLYFYIGSKLNHKYEVAVDIADTANEIGDALEALITADLKAPISSVNTDGSVAITAKNKGTEGNKTGLRVEGSVAGVSVAITTMTGGAINPTLTGLFDVIGEKRYQTIVYPGTYDLSELETLLSARWTVDNNILDGVGIICLSDTLSNLKSAFSIKNNKSIIPIGDKSESETYHKGSAILELDYVKAAQFAAIRALRLTEDAPISDYSIAGSNGGRDSYGGAAISSLPYHNTPFSLLPLIDTGMGFSSEDIKELEAVGVSVLGNNKARNSIIAGSIVTTYKTDAAGNPDESFKYLNYVDTSSSIREYMTDNAKKRFGQSRLTEGDLVEGRNMANANVIKGYFEKMYTDLSGEDYVLTQAGEKALQLFKDNCKISLDLAKRKSTVIMTKVPMVTQLGTIIASMQISFNSN